MGTFYMIGIGLRWLLSPMIGGYWLRVTGTSSPYTLNHNEEQAKALDLPIPYPVE